MSELSTEQQQQLDEQKKQCPFCKIIAGEIPSKKVFEDDKMIAVLDINPASKGHVLVMPKEHYPIMPLIPPETFIHLFAKTKALCGALKEGTVSFGNTVFIANGYAAGQQSNHFMLHIIPREEGDGLDMFFLKPGELDVAKDAEALKMLKHNLPLMLRDRYKLFALAGKETPPADESITYSKEQIIGIIEKNPQLKEIILTQPDMFKKQLHMNPQLQKLFADVDPDDVIKHFNPDYVPLPEGAKLPENLVIVDYDVLVEILIKNPKIKEILLRSVDEFKKTLDEIPQLKEMFGSADLHELLKRLQAKEPVVKAEPFTDLQKPERKEEPRKEDASAQKKKEADETDKETPKEPEKSAPAEESERKAAPAERSAPDLDLISRMMGK
jgi:histidine triad (HIT) family protein